jgi:tRNA pseudouridine38-40 synthase
MPRYFLELAYNGTAYRGWQVQLEAPSVQAEIERAMRNILHCAKVNLVGCGRTDTGVHASRYFAHFDSPEGREFDQRFVHSLNSVLPGDIAMYRIIPVDDKAHARFSATERGYVYRIHREKDPFLQQRSHLLRPALDIDRMNEACAALLTTSDFTSFSRTGSDNRTMICDVRTARWEVQPNGYRFVISADRFLRNMVRAIVGTCIRIGMGHHPPAHMAAVITAMDRHAAGRSAPACGLYLDHVRYPFLVDAKHPLNTGLSV